MRVSRSLRTLTLMCWALSLGLSASAAGYPTEEELKNDVPKLYSANPQTRELAARKLVAAGRRSIPLLLPVLCDDSKPHSDRAWPVAAKALGELRAEAAAPCLVRMLEREMPSAAGALEMKSDEALADLDPAFAALVRIGEPAVPAIRQRLPFLYPGQAYLALRVLRIFQTPSAKEAAEFYIRSLEDRTRQAKRVLQDFGETSAN